MDTHPISCGAGKRGAIAQYSVHQNAVDIIHADQPFFMRSREYLNRNSQLLQLFCQAMTLQRRT